MRKIVFVLMLMLSYGFMSNECMAVTASADKNVDIQQIKAEFDYSELIEAIIAVESEGNVKAVSANGQCCGVLQITPILVKEVNNIVGHEKYSLQDRFDKEKSIEMFYIMQHAHNPSHDMRKAVGLWNRSQWYYKKVMSYYNKAKA